MAAHPADLDETDRRILAELRRDARQSVSALAERVHVSRATAYERMNRLRADGVVLGYTAVVDPVRAGLSATAYVSLRLRQNAWASLREKLRAMPEVHHIALVGGTFDVMLLVRAETTAGLREVVFERLQPLAEVVDTQTVLVFEDEDSR